jgi:hypothetical protein
VRRLHTKWHRWLTNAASDGRTDAVSIVCECFECFDDGAYESSDASADDGASIVCECFECFDDGSYESSDAHADDCASLA